jgi:hypothetical protein
MTCPLQLNPEIDIFSVFWTKRKYAVMPSRQVLRKLIEAEVRLFQRELIIITNGLL